jgi:hypothetical protein
MSNVTAIWCDDFDDFGPDAVANAKEWLQSYEVDTRDRRSKGRSAAKWYAEKLWYERRDFETASIRIQFDDGTVDEWDVEAEVDVSMLICGPRQLAAPPPPTDGKETK